MVSMASFKCLKKRTSSNPWICLGIVWSSRLIAAFLTFANDLLPFLLKIFRQRWIGKCCAHTSRSQTFSSILIYLTPSWESKQSITASSDSRNPWSSSRYIYLVCKISFRRKLLNTSKKLLMWLIWDKTREPSNMLSYRISRCKPFMTANQKASVLHHSRRISNLPRNGQVWISWYWTSVETLFRASWR